jgi:transglutaminase-like putative cysteine protease
VAAAANPALLRASEFLYDSPHVRVVPAVRDYAQASFGAGRSVLQVALDLNRRIHQEFVFDPRATSVSTPVETVLSERRGVCQDFAHLMVACLRAGGLAARYVSGYILTEPPPGQPRLVGADASHAWVSVYCPMQGWVDLDPTNNLTVGDAHVTLAWGRDFGDVTPMRGVILGGGEQEIEVRVTVHPLD